MLSRRAAAVDAGEAVRRALRAEPGALSIAGERVPAAARLRVVAAGKAAAAMAQAVEAVAGDRIAGGVAVTKDGHALPLRRLRLREAAHPVPDARCAEAAGEVLREAQEAGPDDVLLVLLSGGASSLLTAPLPGLALGDLRDTTALLLAAGAPIGELNTVRKHLIALSGGRLAAASRAARVVVLAVSDVLGDPLDVIGSGPCTPDPTRYADVCALLAHRGILERLPAARARAPRGRRPRRARGDRRSPADPAFARVRFELLASNADALAAAGAEARSQGLAAILVSATPATARRASPASGSRRSPAPAARGARRSSSPAARPP